MSDPTDDAVTIAYRNAAKDKQVDGEIEIDDDALVSVGEDCGAYVQAWLWVRADEAGVCIICGEPNADNGEGWDGVCGNCADRANNDNLEG
jgi:hypothetical protein